MDPLQRSPLKGWPELDADGPTAWAASKTTQPQVTVNVPGSLPPWSPPAVSRHTETVYRETATQWLPQAQTGASQQKAQEQAAPAWLVPAMTGLAMQISKLVGGEQEAEKRQPLAGGVRTYSPFA